MTDARRAGELSWETRTGTPVLAEVSDALPLVDVSLVFRFGALIDAPGKEGTARLLARLLRSGAKGQSVQRFDEAIEGLGATLSAEVAHGGARFSGAVLAKNLAPFLELVIGSIAQPAMRKADLDEARREGEAELLARQDDDRWLAARSFRPHLFGAHPYGRSPFGTLRSLPRITLRDLEEARQAHVHARNLIIGLAGAVDQVAVVPLLDRLLAPLPRSGASPLNAPPVALQKGRRVLFVDKPERTQVQLQIGTLATKLSDPRFHPLLVANTAFGGSMTSRLMRAVRVERGYSYSASARVGADQQREAFSMYAHPATADAAACARLELELFEDWVTKGLTASELAQARSYLVKSHAFERDTPFKRLEPRLDAALHGLPRSFWAGFVDRVRQTTVRVANDAARTVLSPSDVAIVALGTGDAIASAMQKLPGVSTLARVSYDSVALGD